MRLLRLTLIAVACATVVAACGSSSNSSTSSASSSGSSGSSGSSSSSGGLTLAGLANTKPDPSAQHMGGTLTVTSAEGWEHLDPAASYFQIDYLVVYATQTPLYTFTPTSNTPVPLLASGPPQVSADGKTVTVHIKSDWKFGPPVNRVITSKDVAWAFQRMFNSNVQNGYAAGYFPIVGANPTATSDKPIPGISTPNATTIVFHLTKPFGATMADALTLPGTSAVPAGYTTKADKSSPSTWDSDPTSQVFTGPYMISSYKAGQSLTLVRNPNWSRTVDGVRPAYSDKIVWNAGADPTVAARQTLDSTNLLMADTPPAAVLKSAYETKKTQLSIGPLGIYYAALNTTVPPFNNINLRKAAIAASNRSAYLLARGGPLVGHVATHFIYPEVPGFQQAGGYAGFGQDFVSHPDGDMTVACKYMKLAGYPNCKYTGQLRAVRQRPDRRVQRCSRAAGDAGRPVRAHRARLQDVDQGGAAADDVLEVLRVCEGARQRVSDGGVDRGLPGSVCRAVRAVQRRGHHADQQQQLGEPQRPGRQRGASTRTRRSPISPRATRRSHRRTR